MPVIQDHAGLTLDKIVLATDFTPSSENATLFARQLAQRFSSQLTLANVVDLSISTPSEAALVGLPIDELRTESLEHLAALQADIGKEKLRVQTRRLESHNPAGAIVELSRQLQAGLIVMGTNARRGFRKLILGSVSEGVIRHADCPVLTLGPKVRPGTGKSAVLHAILFATDFGPAAAEEAALALAIAQDSAAQLYLCHVIPNSAGNDAQIFEEERRFREALQKLVPDFTYEYCTPRYIVDRGDAAQKIVELADKVCADLVVLGARRSHLWFTRMLEGVVGKVLGEVKCPVLTVCA